MIKAIKNFAQKLTQKPLPEKLGEYGIKTTRLEQIKKEALEESRQALREVGEGSHLAQDNAYTYYD